jgi:sporulation protein YlmC with PRC-barrel domain
MRLSELLDREVLDQGGHRVGFVADIRLVQDGPRLGPHGQAWRVAGLVVVQNRHMRLLGYERNAGPRLLAAIVRWLTGGVVFVPWDQIDAPVGGATLTLKITAAEQLLPLEGLPSRPEAPTSP